MLGLYGKLPRAREEVRRRRLQRLSLGLPGPPGTRASESPCALARVLEEGSAVFGGTYA